MTLGAAMRKAERNGGSWLPGHLWRPNGPPDYRIGEGEDALSRANMRTDNTLCALADSELYQQQWRIITGRSRFKPRLR